MTHPSKTKGNAYEREIIQDCLEHGLVADRAWGSDGRSMGLDAGTDVALEGVITLQARRRKRLPQYLQPGQQDILVAREDRGRGLAIIRWEDMLAHMAIAKQLGILECFFDRKEKELR